ncbi:uncharacterized protein PADG_05314 [Paracoccidioides brasiliensis Pb18]|uniref:Uncharacterized protein n=1 Tax=Paracoccidioides brasiliensis (strain Pb18) TaxID=502780 RepID=C1GDH8_PARBD|nr:uncharacterized protein PADG_05314 [Paracoccidioides brasiliensis Pb18]EEH49235.1 hypothetical protein PADG_05314 [Paracoccidioides brasiliensis Pb18]ODH45752.1 hypothetical protein GX48_08167 [Paracoccidioides brasiliensis]
MENEVLREVLGLRGSIIFEGYTNLGHPQENSLSEEVPHKLTQTEMATGLTKEIRPAQDVIDGLLLQSQLSSSLTWFTKRCITVMPLQSGIRGRTRRERPGSAAKPRGAPGCREVSGSQWMPNVIETPAIKTRPYCSQQCLLALKDGSPLDPSCPNYQDHQKGRIQIHSFRSRFQRQLAMDRGPDADCCPLYKAGSCGALFKVRLSSHGYTVVPEGVEYGQDERDVVFWSRGGRSSIKQ